MHRPGFPPVPSQLPLQQSVSAMQTSFSCLQSEVAAQNPPVQSPEQQSPFPAHAFPAAWHPPPPVMDPQVPLQVPPQHWAAEPHAVPSGEQGAVAEQKPFVQNPEQQSAAPAQGLPAIRHWGGRAASHVPDVPQLPVQHCTPPVHACPWAMQH
jgi:hypothetical protein